MRSKINNREHHPGNTPSHENPGVPAPSPPSKQELGTRESEAPDETGQGVAFTIVDDPKNESVYKGPGSYAATRAETAVHDVEKAFPSLHFELRFERNLTALHVQARVRSSVDNEILLAALSKALKSTGTRLAPIVGELCENSFVATARTAMQENTRKNL